MSHEDLITKIHNIDMGDGCPVWVSAAVLPPDQWGRRRVVSGRGLTQEQANSRCLAEAYERHAAIYNPCLKLVQSAASELAGVAVDPTSLLLISDRQYEQREAWNREVGPDHHLPEKFDMSRPVHWVAADSLLTAGTTFLPAAFCFLGYPLASADGFPVPDSSGLACGNSRESAIERSLLELIERDAVSLWWYGRVRRPPMEIDRDAIPGWEEFATWLNNLGRDFWLLDLTNDLGIPVSAAISCDTRGSDLAFGFGAARTREEAAIAAMGELVQFEASKRLYLSQKTHSPPGFLAWCRAADIGKDDFLRPQASEAAIHTRRIECHTEYREMLKEHNLPAFVVHYPTTRPDIHVTRAVVPGLRHMWPRFAAGRLYETPYKLGWHRLKITEDEVNPIAILY